MYLKEIIQLISWPISIYIVYRITFWAIKKFDKKDIPND